MVTLSAPTIIAAPLYIVKTANRLEGGDLFSIPPLYEAPLRVLLVQRQMSSGRVTVSVVGAREWLERSLVVNNDVIEALTPDRATQPLDAGVLPK